MAVPKEYDGAADAMRDWVKKLFLTLESVLLPLVVVLVVLALGAAATCFKGGAGAPRRGRTDRHNDDDDEDDLRQPILRADQSAQRDTRDVAGLEVVTEAAAAATEERDRPSSCPPTPTPTPTRVSESETSGSDTGSDYDSAAEDRVQQFLEQFGDLPRARDWAPPCSGDIVAPCASSVPAVESSEESIKKDVEIDSRRKASSVHGEEEPLISVSVGRSGIKDGRLKAEAKDIDGSSSTSWHL